MRAYEKELRAENGDRSSMKEEEKPVLSACGLSVGYHKVPLIRDIVLGVKPGQIVTLIGPNGAGKSTILKSIAGQLKTLGGEVYLSGKAESAMAASDLAKELAVVVTDRSRPELMTCRDVVAMGRYPYTGRLGVLSGRDREKVNDILKQVGAEKIAEQDFATVSDGQRQRILLARALCQETPVLILDEPTSFLDLHYKRSLLRLIRRQAKEHRTAIVMSLHELDLAKQISDRIVCVKGDRIWKAGTPEDIFTEDTIEALFDLPAGSYDAVHGVLRLGSDDQ